MENKKVLATVGGREVLEQDLNLLLNGLDPQKSSYFATGEGRKQLLDDLIAQELIYLDAVKNGLDKNEDFLKEARVLQDNLLKQLAIYNLLKNIKLKDDELLDFYNKNSHMFLEPETIKASHILVDNEYQAKKIAREIDGGLSFEKAAAKYSTCPSNAAGGDLGFFSRGKMVPEFETIAFDMELDEISKPVKTQFGYHIIKLTGRKEGSVQAFDEVKNQLNQHLLDMKRREIYFNKANELKQEYEVVIYE